MAVVIDFFSAPPQDAIFGIHQANIVPRLTTDNWRTRATVRLLGTTSLYVWIKKGMRVKVEEEVYGVSVETDGRPGTDLEATFSTLSEALAYANGEGGGGLGASTPTDRLPAERDATWVVSSVVGRR